MYAKCTWRRLYFKVHAKRAYMKLKSGRHVKVGLFQSVFNKKCRFLKTSMFPPAGVIRSVRRNFKMADKKMFLRKSKYCINSTADILLLKKHFFAAAFCHFSCNFCDFLPNFFRFCHFSATSLSHFFHFSVTFLSLFCHFPSLFCRFLPLPFTLLSFSATFLLLFLRLPSLFCQFSVVFSHFSATSLSRFYHFSATFFLLFCHFSGSLECRFLSLFWTYSMVGFGSSQRRSGRKAVEKR